MTAGTSGGIESRRQLMLAENHERAATLARHTAALRTGATHSERDVSRALAPLTAVGYHFLPDRGWPGSPKSQVDLVVVGPSGLFIVDTESWSDVTVDDSRVYRHDVDVTDDLASLADLAYATEARMAELGLAPGEVHALVVLAGRSGIKARIGTVEMVGETDAVRYILGRGMRLTYQQVDDVLAASLEYFPIVGTPVPEDLEYTEPGVTDDADWDTIPFLTNTEVTRQIEANFKAPPIEEWMSFLDPEQARLARRSFNGPARIRGAAGTGKTVVGLHRAAYLARSGPGIVLVTSFVSTLPAVQASLMDRLAPDIRGRIEFVGTHAFAKRLLSDRGIRCNLQPAIADAEFDTVWRLIGKPGALGRLEPKPTYWEDEIEHVIKGRGITTFEQYVELSRTGRRRGLTLDQRRAVWELYTTYQARMNARGAHDYADLVLMAEASLRDVPLERYAAVIVDEAQDLSSAMIRMLHHLVGNKPDGLTLIGDGQQTIYPGGYTLGEVGISLVGRGVVMSTNYRNTAEILDFAATMVAGDEYLDIEGAPAVGDDVTEIARSGPAPLVVRFTNRNAHDAELPRRVRALVADGAASLGDIGVLALTIFGVRSAIAALKKANIPVVELTNFDGRPVNAVKVGTVKRAKGLEFKQVLLAHVPVTLLPSRDAVTIAQEGAAAEHTELQKRELYVAMTRARNGLWIGTVP
ncbi:MAG: helicase UvrD [Glaciihabitans sp.]|nr:helicase UvrD [Glaciihabitans sp.]